MPFLFCTIISNGQWRLHGDERTLHCSHRVCHGGSNRAVNDNKPANNRGMNAYLHTAAEFQRGAVVMRNFQ